MTPAGPEHHEIRDRGWTFVHTRTARARTRADEAAGDVRRLQAVPGHHRTLSGLEGTLRRHQVGRHGIRYEYYRERSDRMRGEPGEEAIDDLMNNEHYQDGIDAAIGGDSSDRNEWLIEQQERQRDAVRHAVVVIDTLPTTSTGDPEYAPWDDVAVPAMSGSQRLGMSGHGR